jgi:hypothetical protein
MWYESHFQGGKFTLASGEISPSYFPDWDAPLRAWNYRHDMKLVIAMRDPIQRAYSNFLHDIRVGYFMGAERSFESALSNNPMYVEQSMFGKHLSRWLEYFPFGQMLVLFQEEIAVDPVANARRLYSFLGLDPNFTSEFLTRPANASYVARYPLLEKYGKSAARVLRTSGLAGIDRMLRNSGLKEKLKSANRLDIRGAVAPIDPDIEVRLHTVFAKDTLTLASVIGRDSLPWDTWRAASGRAS